MVFGASSGPCQGNLASVLAELLGAFRSSNMRIERNTDEGWTSVRESSNMVLAGNYLVIVLEAMAIPGGAGVHDKWTSR